MSRNLFEYHPIIGYRFIPGLRARVRHEGGGYLIRCNRTGFRCDHEVQVQNPKHTFRVLLFGDSYTAGEGVSNKNRFGDLLEKRFPDMEILNFALPASGTDQQFLTFREYAAELTYDLLLICPLVENISRNVASHRLTQSTNDGRLVRRAKPYFVLRGGQLELCHQPVPKQVIPVENLTPRTVENAAVKETLIHRFLRGLTRGVDRRVPGFRAWTQRLRRLRLPPEYESPTHPSWLLMRHILADWAAMSKTEVLLSPLPTFAHIEQRNIAKGYQRRFREFSEQTGVAFADILPHFWHYSSDIRRRCRFPVDEHPTILGHRIIADALAPFLEVYYKKWKDAREPI